VSQRPFPQQLSRALLGWWREHSQQQGHVFAVRLLVRELWDFLRDSSPERRRQRFGDMEYDWDHRVNTTAGTVGWRDRLLGVFLSAYQPTDPAAFCQMMNSLPIDVGQYTFVDLGSGKGRTLLMASEWPFRRIMGVEMVPELHRASEQNIRDYHSPTQRCHAIESICTDASAFPLPPDPLVVYLFNPFSEKNLDQVLANLASSLQEAPRAVYVLYHNPILEGRLHRVPWLELIHRGEQFSLFRHLPG